MQNAMSSKDPRAVKYHRWALENDAGWSKHVFRQSMDSNKGSCCWTWPRIFWSMDASQENRQIYGERCQKLLAECHQTGYCYSGQQAGIINKIVLSWGRSTVDEETCCCQGPRIEAAG
jgi:hypothetical protein